MPITSSAIKAARQNLKRRDRRQPFNTRMKTAMRSFSDLVKAGKTAEAVKTLPSVYKAVDTAAKKHLIHRSNAARKKSLLARMLATNM